MLDCLLDGLAIGEHFRHVSHMLLAQLLGGDGPEGIQHQSTSFTTCLTASASVNAGGHEDKQGGRCV